MQLAPHRPLLHLSLLSLCASLACTPIPGDIGFLTEETGSGASDGATTGESGSSLGASTGAETSDSEGGSNASGDSETEGIDCENPGYEPTCAEDVDNDGIPLCVDNAPDHYNPDQLDIDQDGFGDVMDLCPASPDQINSADKDKDGVGDNCDRCRAADYNELADQEGVPAYLRVRNIPLQGDLDHDGIGDVCDNCVAVANCEGFDAMNPATENDLPVNPENPETCQTPSSEHAMLGAACVVDGVPLQLPEAAGPVGYGPDDDLDQDGLPNISDLCPRQPVAAQACESDADCPEHSACAGQRCNHRDPDGDMVGTRCDTCPFVANPEQVTDGGAEADDPDGDFVGSACELHCDERKNPRPIAHYPVSVGGYCCVATWYDKVVHYSPDGLVLLPDCEGDPDCHPLPASVMSTPGVLTPPPGCEAALAEAGLSLESHAPLDLADPLVNNDIDVLRSYACLMPPLDHDFDGIADSCDLCPFAFDPNNEPYIDNEGKLWPDYGKYCNGDYDPKVYCAP